VADHQLSKRGAGDDEPAHGGVFDGRTGLELLGPQECWRLLRSHQLGRIGIVVDGEPAILPVNYAAHGRTIVFRTAGGTKLDAVTTWPAVAFELDGTTGGRGGWSVLAVGPAEEVHGGAELRELEALGLEPWAPGTKLHWVRITPRRVSGRRLPAPKGSRR
jgi:nitroimidazol reductase NimA-like FMN-containing flavoprotein (pyridoxamine 5'-phosphate oxidase superfamily)